MTWQNIARQGAGAGCFAPGAQDHSHARYGEVQVLSGKGTKSHVDRIEQASRDLLLRNAACPNVIVIESRERHLYTTSKLGDPSDWGSLSPTLGIRELDDDNSTMCDTTVGRLFEPCPLLAPPAPSLGQKKPCPRLSLPRYSEHTTPSPAGFNPSASSRDL